MRRLPKYHRLTHAAGRRQAVAELGLAPGQVRRFARVQLDGVWRQSWVKALAADESGFLFAADGLHHLKPLYAGRWTTSLVLLFLSCVRLSFHIMFSSYSAVCSQNDCFANTFVTPINSSENRVFRTGLFFKKQLHITK